MELMRQATSACIALWRSLLGAIIFYTIFPIPTKWQPSFYKIARWCPFVGLFIGGILSSVFLGLTALKASNLIIGAAVTGLWLLITGGLHLDGAMDSADGLAVIDPAKRLEVMADSVTGAFGAMTAVLILLFKFAAIASLAPQNWWLLLITPMWGRWSQVTAIAFFPYLKPAGKGAFHKQDFHLKTDLLFASIPNICSFVLLLLCLNHIELSIFIIFFVALAVAIAISLWFARQFGGHTGDTYGAVVEWSESNFLLLSCILLTPQ